MTTVTLYNGTKKHRSPLRITRKIRVDCYHFDLSLRIVVTHMIRILRLLRP